MIRFRPLFGLKWSRVPEWIKDLRNEQPGLDEYMSMALMTLKAVLRPISHREYIHRLTVCHRCPIFNKQFKSCRNGEQGCGCYVAYKAKAPVDCWLREQDPKKGWGIADLAQSPKKSLQIEQPLINLPI